MSGYANYPFQGRTGVESATDGNYQPFRVTRDGAAVNDSTHGQHYEAASRGNVYHLINGPTTTALAVGNLVGAAAAAVVQFALWNPVGSGVNFSLLEFGVGIISGTIAGGPIQHGYLSVGLGDTLPTIASVTAANTPGPINALIGGPNNSKSKYVCTLASSGTTLTGGSAPRVLKVSNFSGTATAQASVSLVNAVENLEGKIVLGPGSLWLPLYPAVGTSVLLVQSVTWEEIPA